MKAEIVVIGNEVLSGYVVDSNSAFLSLELSKLGIEVTRKIVLPDRKEEILETLKQAIERSDIIFITGGLGPTHDDITKKTISSFLKRRLILNDNILHRLKAYFKKQDTDMHLFNSSQALVPQGAIILENPVGTAPGLLFKEEETIIILLPGVPSEMKAIFKEKVQPYLETEHSGEVILSKTLHTTGISESMLYEKLKNSISPESIVFLPFPTGVDIRITTKGKTLKEANTKLSRIANSLLEKIEDFYYGSDDETLERVISILLTMRSQTLSVAESCTAGLLMKRITDIPGSSNYFLGGVVSYSNEVKIKVLKVKEKTLKQKGAVSSEVAEGMAEGVRNLLKADFGVSITGVAGPTGGTADKPVGLVYIGIADRMRRYSKVYHFIGTREIIRERAAQAALDLLRKRLLGTDKDGK